MLVTLLVVAPLPVLTRLFALARLVPIASKLRADELPGFLYPRPPCTRTPVALIFRWSAENERFCVMRSPVILC